MEGLIAKDSVSVVESIQDESTVVAVDVVVRLVDPLSCGAAVKADEHGCLHGMPRIERRGLAVQGSCKVGEEARRFRPGEATNGRAER